MLFENTEWAQWYSVPRRARNFFTRRWGKLNETLGTPNLCPRLASRGFGGPASSFHAVFSTYEHSLHHGRTSSFFDLNLTASIRVFTILEC